MRIKHLLATLSACAVLVSNAALADGRDAARNLFNNLARAKASLSTNVNASNAMVAPTLVKGMYAIHTQRGQFVGYTNEAGTLFGDSRGFNVLAPNGVRPLGLDEVADLRSEIMGAIDYDKLVKVTYGDGGGRRLVMFSAVDCPSCKVFEDDMQRLSTQANTTFYVVPSSLQRSDRGGAQAWQAATRIWCAEEPGAAWQAFWSTKAIPAPRQCRFEVKTAEVAGRQLQDLLQAAGTRITGTPQIVREDGARLNRPARLDEGFVAATYGPAGMPDIPQKPPRWLAVANTDTFQLQPVGGAPENTRSARSSQKVDLEDALKKLFK